MAFHTRMAVVLSLTQAIVYGHQNVVLTTGAAVADKMLECTIIGGWTALFCGTVCYDVQGVSADEALRCYLLSEQYFLVVLFIVLYKVVLAFELSDDILKC